MSKQLVPLLAILSFWSCSEQTSSPQASAPSQPKPVTGNPVITKPSVSMQVKKSEQAFIRELATAYAMKDTRALIKLVHWQDVPVKVQCYMIGQLERLYQVPISGFSIKPLSEDELKKYYDGQPLPLKPLPLKHNTNETPILYVPNIEPMGRVIVRFSEKDQENADVTKLSIQFPIGEVDGHYRIAGMKHY